MSYLRYAWGLHHVAAKSEDYIFESSHEDGTPYIEDYGNISNNGLVELICDALEEYFGEYQLITPYLKNKIAERLNVKLRKTKITQEQSIAIGEGQVHPVTLKPTPKVYAAKQRRWNKLRNMTPSQKRKAVQAFKKKYPQYSN